MLATRQVSEVQAPSMFAACSSMSWRASRAVI
jgi:hypothetical protein